MKVEIKKPVMKLAITGLFAAVICVSAWISIPTPWGVPITLQTLAVSLCAYFLGARLGTLTVAVYIALGAAGLPVFSSFGSGFGVLLGFTGGYIWGFVLMALFCGTGSGFRNRFASLGFGLIGLTLCHIPGIVQFSLVSGRSFSEAFLIGSAPYLIKDAVSVAAAYFISLGLAAGVKKAGLYRA